MTESNEALAQEIARYILEFEEDDFKYYCDQEKRTNHIYLKAYRYLNGDNEAQEMLKEVRVRQELSEKLWKVLEGK